MLAIHQSEIQSVIGALAFLCLMPCPCLLHFSQSYLSPLEAFVSIIPLLWNDCGFFFLSMKPNFTWQSPWLSFRLSSDEIFNKFDKQIEMDWFSGWSETFFFWRRWASMPAGFPSQRDGLNFTFFPLWERMKLKFWLKVVFLYRPADL